MTKNAHNPILQAALAYADLGYRVFPCVPGDKHPLTPHGFHDATTDPDQIEQWWAQWPDANVAIATRGLIVIDVEHDSRWLMDDPEKALSLAIAPSSITARGGRHYFFRPPKGKCFRCTTQRIADKVDTRAEGGYVVVPPSQLSPQQCYRWAPDQSLDVGPERLPVPPDWLMADLDRGSTEAVPEVQANANLIPEGHRNDTLARLAGSMRRTGMSRAEILAALNQINADRCLPPLSDGEVQRIAASIARYDPDGVTVALMENHWEQDQKQREEEAPEHGDPGPLPEHLLEVPGFIRAVMDHTLQTAPYPQRALAFCGALTLQAHLAGRKVQDQMGNRTNLFVLALANSGTGKDHPRKINQQILMQVGLASTIGDAFASGEGIEDRMLQCPAMLFQTDEIDGLMLRINQGKEGRHESIMNVLLKMYTSSNSFYPMRVKAGREPEVIDQPCLCLLGTAVPKHYYEALSLRMLTNGLLARMLVVEAGKRGRGQSTSIRDVSPTILQTAHWWTQMPLQQGNLQRQHPLPLMVPDTPDAADVFAGFRDAADHQYTLAEDRDDTMAMAIWARASEKARRLALVHACSESHKALRIEEHAARWACELVDHQTRRMLFMATGHVSESSYDARCKAVLTTLHKWKEKHGSDWMPFWRISRKHPWSEKDHEEVRGTLLNQHLIEYEQRKTGGAPQRLYRLRS